MRITEVMAERLFGTTKDEAHSHGVCIRCNEPVEVNDLLPLDRKEYDITALCPGCWDALFPDEEDEP